MVDSDGKQATKTVQDAVDTAAAAAGSIAHDAGNAASEAAASVREAARKVGAAASDIGQEAVARGTRYGKTVVEEVEAQPMTFLVVAAAAGLVAGWLIARR